MILNSDDSNTRKFLVSLILAALLVNFSLFFTKIIIEVSNTLASEIAMSGFVLDDKNMPSVSASFMNVTGLNNVYNFEGGSTSAGWGYIFGTAILFIVSMFVFAAGAFMLIIRYVALILYMIFSPIMFIGWVFPQLQKYTDQYWSGFLGRAFFAPIYILLVYLAITVATSFYKASAGQLGEAQLASTFGPGAAQSFTATIPPFVVSIVLMLAAVVVSSKMSADGADGAISMGKKAASWSKRKVQNGAKRTGGALTLGLAARGGRATIGRVGNSLANNESLKQWAANSKMGEAAIKTARTAAGASFDARNVGGLGKNTGIGNSKTGGYKKQTEDAAKKKVEFGESLGKDMSDPKNIADVEKRIPEVRAEKLAQAESVSNQKQTFDGDKGRTKGALEADITDLKRQIDDNSKQLKEGMKAGSLTTKEVKNKEKDIDKMRSTIASKETSAEHAGKRQDLAYKYSKASQTAGNAPEGSKQKAKAEAEMRQVAEDTEALDAEIEGVSKALSDKATKLTAEAANAKKIATAEVKYGNQIDYIKRLEKSENAWGGIKSKMTGGAAGTAAAVVGAGAGLGVGAAVGAVGYGMVAEQSDVSKIAKNDLLRKYGADGMKGQSSEDKENSMKNMVKLLQEQGAFQTNNGPAEAPTPKPETPPAAASPAVNT